MYFRVLHNNDAVLNNNCTTYTQYQNIFLMNIYHYFFEVSCRQSKIAKMFLGGIFNAVVLLGAMFNYNSSFLHTFHAIWLLSWRKSCTLYLIKSRPGIRRIYFPFAVSKDWYFWQHLYNILMRKLGVIRNELLFLWILSMFKLQQITNKLNMLSPYSVCMWFSEVYI